MARARVPVVATIIGEGGSGGEKVFDPSPQRLQEARKRGDIPRSADMNAAVSYLALLLVILAAGGVLVAKSGGVLTRFLAEPDRLVGQILGPGGGGVSAGLVGADLVLGLVEKREL